METTGTADFRDYLRKEWLRRCQTNPRYSLRSFSRYLRMDHSTLSQFLRGKRKLSLQMQQKMARRLRLNKEDLSYFWPDGDVRGDDSFGARDLTVDTFKVLSDWYHWAIFELVTVTGFESDPQWIAKKLDITSAEAQAALDRLVRLELLEQTPDGKYRQGSPMLTTTGNPFTTVAFRTLQAQLLGKALVALEKVPLSFRDQTGMTMAIPSERLPEAKERIKQFRRELCAWLQENSKRDSVYQLSISLFPLTSISAHAEGKALQ